MCVKALTKIEELKADLNKTEKTFSVVYIDNKEVKSRSEADHKKIKKLREDIERWEKALENALADPCDYKALDKLVRPDKVEAPKADKAE